MVQWLITAQSAPITDNSIRQRAREIADANGIDNERFKASSGWVENFKSRHGVRGGIWHGNGMNTRTARALGLGYRRNATPSPPPSHPVLPSMQEMLPEYDDYTRNPRHHTFRSSSDSSMHYPSPGPSTIMPPPPLDDDPNHSRYYHYPSPNYQPSPELYDEDAVYAPVPEIPDNTTVPTMDQAENHMNKLILFFSSPEGDDILNNDDYEALQQIKISLFQAAGGIRRR